MKKLILLLFIPLVFTCSSDSSDDDTNPVIVDTTAPVITINGDNPQELNIGEDYIEFGATAIDDIDGDITQDIIIDSSNLNTALAGNYAVTYSVSDSSNNSTIEEREVIIIDNSIGNCDGAPYDSIVYGAQEWTVENACHITYRGGTPIPEVTDPAQWSNLTTGAWSYYNNDPTKPRLYNWYAVMGIHDEASLLDASLRKEFAPEGWHVPSDSEWTTLENHLIVNGYNYDGTTTENKIAKAMASTTGWVSQTNAGAPGNDQSINNSSGFNAFPEGYHNSNGPFYNEGNSALFWSSTEYNTLTAWPRILNSTFSNMDWSLKDKKDGFSVRFVRD